MSYDIIVAVDKTMGIGRSNSNAGELIWNLKPELDYFRSVTTYTNDPSKRNAIIMGRNTWNSIGKVLPGRLNVVLSKSTREDLALPEDVLLFNNFTEAVKACNTNETIEATFVIGGEQIYNLAVKENKIRSLYITLIDHDYSCDLKFKCGGLEMVPRIIKRQGRVMILHDTKNNIDVSVGFLRLEIGTGPHFQPIGSLNSGEKGYLALLEKLVQNPAKRTTRNGDVSGMFGRQLIFDLGEGFPLLTTKKMFIKGIFEELSFFLKGQTDSKLLSSKGVKIWEGNTTREFLDSHNLAYDVGDMGPMYGFNWRHFGASYDGCSKDYTGKGLDQLSKCLELIRNDPFSRRIIMTTYNPACAEEGVLYPCHGLVIQFYVEILADGKRSLSCHMYQRSCDWFLGVPFNIASYALLVHMICEVMNNTGSEGEMIPGQLIMSFGDLHLYSAHYEQACVQLVRTPYLFPRLKFNGTCKNLEDFTYDNLELVDYRCHPGIRAEMIA